MEGSFFLAVGIVVGCFFVGEGLSQLAKALGNIVITQHLPGDKGK